MAAIFIGYSTISSIVQTKWVKQKFKKDCIIDHIVFYNKVQSWPKDISKRCIDKLNKVNVVQTLLR